MEGSFLRESLSDPTVSNHSFRGELTRWKATADWVSVCVYNFMCILCVCVSVKISQHPWRHHGRVSSSRAHVLMAEVVCWSSCHVELVRDNAWPCRHDMDTSPLQEKQRTTCLRVCSQIYWLQNTFLELEQEIFFKGIFALNITWLINCNCFLFISG